MIKSFKWADDFKVQHELEALESALSTIQSDQYYPEFEAKLTKLVFSANKNHVFIEWNKRTSIALWAFFLEINGFDYRVGKFIVEMENIAVAVAEDLIDQEFLLEIITLDSLWGIIQWKFTIKTYWCAL
jgi:death-on-curing protein